MAERTQFSGLAESKILGVDPEDHAAERELSRKIENEYQQKQKERLEALEQSYTDQLVNFIKDDSYFKYYEKFAPLKEKSLVKLFRFIPPEETGTALLGLSTKMVQSIVTGEWSQTAVDLPYIILPIVKIIKKGREVKDTQLVEGGVYIVAYSDIMGESFNPDFMWMMQNFAKNGKNGIVHIPDDMPQKIPNIEKNWERYKFYMPDKLGRPSDDEKMVYLIPENKFDAIYLP